MNVRGVFVTGTDTEVGKTVVAASIAAVLRERGYDAGVMKPVATGCRYIDGELAGDDALFLIEAGGSTDPISTISPFSYKPPVAPTVAATLAGRRIDLNLVTECFVRLARNHDLMIVEGIGGIMVPLDDCLTVIDMARKLNLPLIIVARPSLGTINHTLLTVRAAEAAGLAVAAVVLNRYPPDPVDLVAANNPGEISARIDAPVFTMAEAVDVDIGCRRLGTAVELMRRNRLMDVLENLIL